jgi:phosphopantothenoylcysteine decarboxylase/phosphopantothenate--cysteine ligase
MSNDGKNILLGITGSIAAYKSAFLTRLLVKDGANVQVIMTRAATEFVSPLTLSTLSRNAVHLDLSDGSTWDNHVELGLWADLFIVAPVTANSMAKFANGLADNMLVATYLSAKCPVWIAPAMDLDMWKHPANQQNIQKLEDHGVKIIPVGEGELASGLVGEGRMAEPQDIFEMISGFVRRTPDGNGKTVLITAGPTYEPIDPVRFIGNHSSGKMGIAIAQEFAARGAEVHLVLGPSNLKPQHPSIRVYPVQTAGEMSDEVNKLFPGVDIAVLAAAVSDYRPRHPSKQKIKKSKAEMMLEMELNPDIAASIGSQKSNGQIVVGFALETENELANAKEKLKKKNFDFVVLNTLNTPGAGFNVDTNQVTFVFPDRDTIEFPLKSKRSVARDIADEAMALIK